MAGRSDPLVTVYETMRSTHQRRAIEEVIRRVPRPLCVEEIVREGRKTVPSLNEATVYRNLKGLTARGVLRRIKHPELGTLYEVADKDHHHHFHCRVCERVFELPGCALSESDATPPGFVTETHEVFLNGVCASCGPTSRKQKSRKGRLTR